MVFQICQAAPLTKIDLLMDSIKPGPSYATDSEIILQGYGSYHFIKKIQDSIDDINTYSKFNKLVNKVT